MAQEKVLSIFLASPGDLEPERRSARTIVDDLNHTLAKEAGIFLSLMGWEDTLPGAGRPQHLINADVEKCDLFVGVIWKRWGTPSGECSSGFEEEFSIASRRREASLLPELWLAFKQVDTAQMEDPGEQLQKVLAFKESVRSSRKLLYKEFTTVEDWSAKFRSWLSTTLIRNVRQHVEPLRTEDRSTDITSLPEPSTPPDTKPVDQARLPRSLVKAVAELAEATKSDSVERYQAALAGMQESNVAELFLTLKAAIADRLTADTLGGHEINVLYRWREEISPVGIESDLIFRTLLADDDDTHPGWFWYRTASMEDLRDYVLYRTAFDADFSVRVGAGKMLLDLHMPLSDASDLLELTSSSYVDGKRAIVSWLAELGSLHYKEVLRAFGAADPRLNDDVRSALLILDLRTKPLEALLAVATEPNLPDAVRDRARSILPDLASESLLEFLAGKTTWLRIGAAKILLERGELSAAVAKDLLTDDSPLVRRMAVVRLASLGILTDREEIRKLLSKPQSSTSGLAAALGQQESIDLDAAIEHVFSRLPETELLEAVDWYSLDGPIAYFVLLRDHFNNHSATALTDINSHFERIKKQSALRFERSMGPEGRQRLEQAYAQYDSFIEEQFLEAALKAFGQNDPASVLLKAREVVGHTAKYLRMELLTIAADVIGSSGETGDLPFLIAAVDRSYGPAREALIRSIVALAASDTDYLLLLNSSTPSLVSTALGVMPRDRVVSLQEDCKKLLHSMDARVRVAATVALVQAVPPEQSERMLKDYVNSGTYFYNVVVWFDRLLYVPGFAAIALRRLARAAV